ncbi:hypothetical protein [Pseudoalteromonas sp. 2CM28B]|uniref:hypothetical protein n=1 Tax=Pseudoalteromonas sp. 2CM28B TaxID=2929851 RepID=UPI0020BEC818|nr:hypothetical protein [Pseudoalteromonas sp. 2CM28B]MCK8135898.1 hypothetical protein [Pseudoalteromonas sp. 2CM28B]
MIESKKVWNWTAGTLGIIILGAIGSGVWQIIGEPLVTSSLKFIIDSMDLLFSSYKDSIYIKASKGLHESSANSTYTLIILLFSTLPVAFIAGKKLGKRSSDKAFSDIDKGDVKTLTVVKIAMVLNFVLMISLALNIVTSVSYANRIVVYVDTSLDRLAPHVEPIKVLELRARFREVKSAEDYYALYEQIESLLKVNKLESLAVEPL